MNSREINSEKLKNTFLDDPNSTDIKLSSKSHLNFQKIVEAFKLFNMCKNRAKIRMPKKIPQLQSLANFRPPEKGVFRGKIISKNVQI